jgi:hypothetical protein
MGVRKASAKSAKQSRPQIDENIVKNTGHSSTEDERWLEDIAILRRAAQELTQRGQTAKPAIASLACDNSFNGLLEAFGYSSADHLNESLRELYHKNPERLAAFLKVALRESSPEQRRVMGTALVESGLVNEAINNLTGPRDGESYSAFSLLFLAAKSGVIQPLITVIEEHPDVELRLKLIGLLVSSGLPEVLTAFRRLAASTTLAFELRPVVVEAINQVNIQIREAAA